MEINSLVYRVVEKSNITDEIAFVFIQHLTKQGKVTIPSIDKVRSCCRIVMCFVNDELIVSDEDGLIVDYNPKNSESQRVQETLFNEKQTII
jgi:hypothetical protein